VKVWVMQGIHEGEMYASTHITEKGAALAAVADVLEFLGVEDEETALDVMNARHYGGRQVDHGPEHTEPIAWDQVKMRDMTRDELWGIFGEWTELTWDNQCGYQVDVQGTEIQA